MRIRLCSMLFIFGCLAPSLRAQALQPNALLGRWEVVKYAEQGLQVDKQEAAQPQALKVYRHVQKERAKVWYGYDYDHSAAPNKRQAREFERWEQQDSTLEVARISKAIETPYFAVFFADGTLSLYNKEADTGQTSFPESRHYVFSPTTMSLDIFPPGYEPAPGSSWVDKWDVQIVSLSDTRMTLFLPGEAEVVELLKRDFKLP